MSHRRPQKNPKSPLFDIKQYLPEDIGTPSPMNKALRNVAAIAKYVVSSFKSLTNIFDAIPKNNSAASLKKTYSFDGNSSINSQASLDGANQLKDKRQKMEEKRSFKQSILIENISSDEEDDKIEGKPKYLHQGQDLKNNNKMKTGTKNTDEQQDLQMMSNRKKFDRFASLSRNINKNNGPKNELEAYFQQYPSLRPFSMDAVRKQQRKDGKTYYICEFGFENPILSGSDEEVQDQKDSNLDKGKPRKVHFSKKLTFQREQLQYSSSLFDLSSQQCSEQETHEKIQKQQQLKTLNLELKKKSKNSTISQTAKDQELKTKKSQQDFQIVTFKLNKQKKCYEAEQKCLKQNQRQKQAKQKMNEEDRKKYELYSELNNQFSTKISNNLNKISKIMEEKSKSKNHGIDSQFFVSSQKREMYVKIKKQFDEKMKKMVKRKQEREKKTKDCDNQSQKFQVPVISSKHKLDINVVMQTLTQSSRKQQSKLDLIVQQPSQNARNSGVSLPFFGSTVLADKDETEIKPTFSIGSSSLGASHFNASSVLSSGKNNSDASTPFFKLGSTILCKIDDPQKEKDGEKISSKIPQNCENKVFKFSNISQNSFGFGISNKGPLFGDILTPAASSLEAPEQKKLILDSQAKKSAEKLKQEQKQSDQENAKQNLNKSEQGKEQDQQKGEINKYAKNENAQKQITPKQPEVQNPFLKKGPTKKMNLNQIISMNKPPGIFESSSSNPFKFDTKLEMPTTNKGNSLSDAGEQTNGDKKLFSTPTKNFGITTPHNSVFDNNKPFGEVLKSSQNNIPAGLDSNQCDQSSMIDESQRDQSHLKLEAKSPGFGTILPSNPIFGVMGPGQNSFLGATNFFGMNGQIHQPQVENNSPFKTNISQFFQKVPSVTPQASISMFSAKPSEAPLQSSLFGFGGLQDLGNKRSSQNRGSGGVRKKNSEKSQRVYGM